MAQTIELTTGAILAAALAVVSPIALLAGVFVAVGRHRQRMDHLEAQAKTHGEKIDALRESDTAVTERLRTELDAHAGVLAARLEDATAKSAKALKGAVRALDRRVGSLERWRERVHGADQARHAAQQHASIPPPPPHGTPQPGVPQGQIYDRSTPVMSAPLVTPRVHESSTHYPAALEDSDDGET